ncbi:MAG: amino acid ABC transporter permease [Rhodospirillales bacterium]
MIPSNPEDAAPGPVQRPPKVGWFSAQTSGAKRGGLIAQALLGTILVGLGYLLWSTASENMSGLSAKSGYDFLLEAAPFQLGESLIPYSAGDSYLRAFAVGVLNTIKVAVVAIFLSTLLGLLIALGQLSSSIVISRLCRGYVEVARNVPLLLQLIFWYTFFTRSLPTVREALSPFEGVYLTNRGLFLPSPLHDPAHGAVGLAALTGIALAFVVARAGKRYRHRTGRPFPTGLCVLAALLLPPLAVFLLAGAPLQIENPVFKGFNFQGGISLTPEFAAMVLGLTFYTAAFNAEIIRAGILGVPKGQSEVALALGLPRGLVMRKIVLPQALRIMIPPMTNSYLNLTKESSLGVAIGYPELVRVANVTLSETSQAFECISIIMIVYLMLSLIISGLLNIMNARAKLVER